MIIGPIRLMPALTETYNLSCKESCVLHTRDPHLRPDLGEAVPPGKAILFLYSVVPSVEYVCGKNLRFNAIHITWILTCLGCYIG